MDHYQSTSIKTKIHPKTQSLIRLQFFALIQKRTKSPLMTRITIFTIWKIPTNIINLLIHKNTAWKILRLNKNDYTKTQIMT